MSEGILDNDQVAALVEAAKEGKLPEPAPAPLRRQQRVRPVDFSRPTKFTNDHQRRITRALETFCQTAATRLSAELRWPMELELISTAQVTWLAAHQGFAPGSLAVTLYSEEIGTRMLLSVELQMVLGAIEALLGGHPDRLPRERRLSEIDWSLARRLLTTIVKQLSIAWHELGGVSLEIEQINQHTDTSQVASVSEPTFVVTTDCRVNRHSTVLALLIPWAAIDPIADRIAGRDAAEEALGTDTLAMASALSAAPITLRTEVAARHLPVQEILGLRVGSVIRLGARAENGVAVFAEDIPLGRAEPGASGNRRAVQIRTLGSAGVQ